MATQNRSLFLDFGATDKPCFESSHRSNIAIKDGIYSQLLISKNLTYEDEINRCESPWIGYVD